jgi:hypothetical protein
LFLLNMRCNCVYPRKINALKVFLQYNFLVNLICRENLPVDIYFCFFIFWGGRVKACLYFSF